MGDSFGEGGDAERPVHTVTVSAFCMDKYEVTKTLWDEVLVWAVNHGYVFDNGGVARGATHPVHAVNCRDVIKWCNARSEMEGRVPAYYTSAPQTTVYRVGNVDVENEWVKWDAGYRLPTEAEWEYAARGGLEGRRFPWGDTISHSQANYYSWWRDGKPVYSYDVSPTEGYHPTAYAGPEPFCDAYTTSVGSFAPNAYGLYDMAGNMAELCWDRYGDYESGSQVNPRGPTRGKWGKYRVVRGGYGEPPGAVECRVTFRAEIYFFSMSIECYESPGFRCVLAPGQ